MAQSSQDVQDLDAPIVDNREHNTAAQFSRSERACAGATTSPETWVAQLGQADMLASPAKSTRPNSPPGKVNGFRSALFGKSETEVCEAIAADFGAQPAEITHQTDPTLKTAVLSVTVNELIPDGGTARVAYILGFESRKLIQVNIVWGRQVDPGLKPQDLVNTANILQRYFSTRNLLTDEQPRSTSLSNRSVIVFRGRDEAKRTILLVLHMSRPANGTEEADEKNPPDPPNEIMLQLSYIENSTEPDIFRIKEGDF